MCNWERLPVHSHCFQTGLRMLLVSLRDLSGCCHITPGISSLSFTNVTTLLEPAIHKQLSPTSVTLGTCSGMRLFMLRRPGRRDTYEPPDSTIISSARGKAVHVKTGQAVLVFSDVLFKSVPLRSKLIHLIPILKSMLTYKQFWLLFLPNTGQIKLLSWVLGIVYGLLA